MGRLSKMRNLNINPSRKTEEATVKNVFLAAKAVSMQLSKFEEMIDSPHAFAERWRKRFEELGEPLISHNTILMDQPRIDLLFSPRVCCT